MSVVLGREGRANAARVRDTASSYFSSDIPTISVDKLKGINGRNAAVGATLDAVQSAERASI